MCDDHENSKISVNNVYKKLDLTLAMTWIVSQAKDEFMKLQTNAERVLFVADLLTKYSLYPQLLEEKKNDDISSKYREEGNKAFQKKDNLSAWSFYNKSISYATFNSECLALAYANRSAVLYEKMMYKQCLEDITNAFKNNYPKHLHDKLIQRKRNASERLPSENTVKYYEEIEKVANLQERNKRIECAGPKVEIRKSDSFGRHVVAVEEIKLGEVIAVEKPYVQVLSKNSLRDHCYYCFELCYNMIPCDSCVYAMFCCEKCQSLAWNSYHRYECAILPTLYDLEICDLSLAALRIAIVARNVYGDIENYKPSEGKIYKSQSYEEIHFLETNAHKRRFENLFPEALKSAILRYFVKTGTSLFEDFGNPQRDQKIFVELVMRHYQTALTNFHQIPEIVETDLGFTKIEQIGVGSYAFLSMLNHSCTPNVTRDNHGTSIILRATKPIKKGAELLDQYGCHYGLMEKNLRRKELKAQYFFECVCKACEHDWPIYGNSKERPTISRQLLSLGVGSLCSGNREDMMRFLHNFDYHKDCKNSRDISLLEETLKQCFGLLGNKKPKF